MIKEIVFWFFLIFTVAVIATVLSSKYCSEMRISKACKTKKWINEIKTTMKDGTPIEIIVFVEPRSDDGFAINVHRKDDPPGKCWGTVIYPKPMIE